MKKILIGLLLMLTVLPSVFAQEIAFRKNNPITYAEQVSVSGFVLDSASQSPVAFATISVKVVTVSKQLNSTSCDANGKFELGILKQNRYTLIVSSVGYQSKEYVIDLSKETDSKKQITLTLSPQNTKLSEIKVVASKAIVEEDIDKLIYHADKDINTISGTAVDVLRKVPTLTIDPNDNIAVRGNANVKILVDGKASFTSGGKPSEILKQIPSDNIKRVEVMTSPSAKYDADGSTVVNIITKGKILEGINYSLNGGLGNRSSQGMSNFSYRKKKVTFFINTFGLAFDNKTDSWMSISEKTLGTTNLLSSQYATGAYNGFFLNNKIGLDYKLTEKDYLTLTFDNFNRQINNNRHSEITYFLTNPVLINQDLKTKVKILTNDVSLDYNHKFKNARHELSTSLARSYNNNATRFETSLSSGEYSLWPNLNKSFNQETVFQIDYQNPITRKQYIETGVKLTQRRMFNEASDLNPLTLDYEQRIYASYFTYQVEPNRKWSLKSGLRYEYTKDALENSQLNIGRKYHNLFPTLAVQRKLKNASNTKLNYNYRVQRPSIFFVNPNQSINDPLSRMSGNPSLLPEYTHNIEWSLNTYIKSASLITTLYNRNIRNAISTYNSLEKGVLLTKYINLDQQTDLGFSVYSSFKVLKKVQTTISTNLYHSKLKVGNEQNSGWMYSIGTMESMDFKKGWGVQLYAAINSPRVRLQGNEPGYVVYNISAKKVYKKITLSAGADNLFTPKIPLRMLVESSTFVFDNSTNLYSRGIRVSVNYRIGKLSTRANMVKDKKSGSDLKADEVK